MQDNAVQMISFGILTFNAPKTLENTLQSYKMAGLLDKYKDVFVVSHHLVLNFIPCLQMEGWGKDLRKSMNMHNMMSLCF